MYEKKIYIFSVNEDRKKIFSFKFIFHIFSMENVLVYTEHKLEIKLTYKNNFFLYGKNFRSLLLEK